MAKKLLIALLALVCALTCAFGVAACSLFNRDSDLNSDNSDETEVLTFTLIDGSYTVTGIVDLSSTTIVIPSVYKGLPVTAIGERAFYNCTSLKSVVIPDSVTEIGNSAFEGCSGLTEVTIGKGVKVIGEDAFKLCINIIIIIIPDGVTQIGKGAFAGCSSLNKVTVGRGVTQIDDSVFEGCSGMSSITIPDTVTYISGNAFSGCINLTIIIFLGTDEQWAAIVKVEGWDSETGTLTIKIQPVHYHKLTLVEAKSATCTEAGNTAYYACDGCDKWFNDANGEEEITNKTSALIKATGHSWVNGVCKDCKATESSNLNFDLLSDNTYSVTGIGECADTEIVIPSKHENAPVTRIGNSAFGRCASIIGITVPDTVTYIGDSAFSGCTSLTNITLGNGVTEIGDMAFMECSSLESITIPDSVTKIGDAAFNWCNSLTSIIIGKGLSELCYDNTGITPFSGCPALESIIVDPDNQTYICIDNCLVEKETKTMVLGTKYGVIPADDRVTSIGLMAFMGYESFTSITVPDNISTIKSSAFYFCTALESITLGSGVTTIETYAFVACTALTSITIPDSVTSIEGQAFYECPALKSIQVSSGNTKYHSAGNCIIETESKTLVLGCKNSVIPDDGSVTSIGERAFRECKLLESIRLPDSVISIGSSAFQYCISLTSVYYKGTAEDWADIDMANNNNNLQNATRYYYSETKPTAEGNYWHEVEGEIVIWPKES